MTDLIGKSIDRYHILEQLGEGGMATVYKAYDMRLERDVAIKIIRKKAFPEEQLDRILKRFEREAKALARMSHPNIIKVIDYGEYEGSPYLVVEYFPGGTLKQRLGKPMPWQDAVRLLIPIAEALEYAHEQKIIHRDIKPSNILLMQKGQPMLTDFGIAKMLEVEDAATLTGTGVGVGTPEYMAPEQWTGSATAQSDIYSLGVVLYEMLTGRKPYTADTPAAILLKQATEPLPRPSAHVRDLPDSIEKILLKALARNPKDRYKEAGALVEGLENLLIGTSKSREFAVTPSKNKPVRPDLDTRDTYLQEETYSTKLQAETYDKTPRKTQTTHSTRQPIPPQQKKTVWWPWIIGALGIGFMLYMGFRQEDVYVPATEAPAIVESLAATEAPVLETIKGDNVDRLQHQNIWGGMGASYSMDWSQDDRWIAVGTNIGLYLYNASTYGQIWFTQTDSTIRSVAFSPDGAYVAAGVGNSVKVWLASDGSLAYSLDGHTGVVRAVAFSPDGSLIASGSSDRTIRIWNAADGTPRNTMSDEEGSLRAVAFSPRGDTLASSSFSGDAYIIKIWNLANGSSIQTLTGHESLVSSVSFSTDGTLLASGSYDGTIKVWNTSNWALNQTLPAPSSSSVMDVHFLPDNNRIVSSSSDRTFRIWDISTGQETLNINGHRNGIRSVRYSDSRNQIATASWDGTVKIWSSQDGSLLHTIQFSPITNVIKVTSDNSYIVTSSDDNRVHIFDVQGNEVGVFVGDEIWGMDLSPNDLLAVTDKDGKISLVDMPFGNLVGELHGPTEGVNSVAFSQDGARLVAGYYNNTAIVWDVPNREQILTLQNDTPVETVAFSPTGNMVATGSYDEIAQTYLIKVWNIPDGNIIQVFERYSYSGMGKDIIFSPDGAMIAFPTEEINNGVATRKIELRSTQNGDLIRSFDVNAEEWINAIIFSNDGMMLAVGSSGNSICLWRVSDGQILINLDASIQGVNGIAFAPDMSFLVSAGQDSTIRIWQVQPD
jgi:WD40 repeat protein/serine/threonine protein kinase